jgi:trimethylamine--corrinoid protein Co-methyltransferase
LREKKKLKLSRIEILSRNDIEAIYAAALHILEKVGILYRYEPTLKLMEENGCEVDYKTEIVKIPEGLVEDCLRYTPRQMRFYGRDTKKDMRVVAGERTHVTARTGCRHLLTYPDNNYRPYMIEDIVHKTRLCDYLPLVEGISMPGEGGRNYPEEVSSVYSLEAFYNNTTKPITDYQPRNWVETVASLDIASIVAGGQEEFRKRPIYTAHWCATDPFQWSADGCKSVELYAKSGAPMGLLVAGPVIGATSPTSFAALITQTLAEWLSGLVMAQLNRKGTPVWLGASGPVLEMKKLFWYRTSSTSAIWSAANVQIAHHFNLMMGSIGGGGVSGGESKTINAQWGMEGLYSFLPLLAGGDLIRCGGGVGLGQGVSYEGLLICHEAIKSVLRILEGVEVSPEALALDLFEKEGPGGKFIGYRHTLKWYLKEHVPPEIFDKEVWQKWEEMGRKDIVERAHEKVVEILDAHHVEPLPGDVLRTIHDYQKKYGKKVQDGVLVPGMPTQGHPEIL